MKREIIEQDVEGFGTVRATELTVAELAVLKGSNFDPKTQELDGLLARHGITTAALNKSLGLDLSDRLVVELHIDEMGCDGCRECIPHTCPVGGYNLQEPEAGDAALSGAESWKVIPLLSKYALQGCADCGRCVEVCPQGVFEVVYADYRPSQLNKLVEIFNEVNPDFFLAREHKATQQEENLAFIKWEIEQNKKGKK